MKAGALIDLLMHYSQDDEVEIEVYETISGLYIDTTADITVVEKDTPPGREKLTNFSQAKITNLSMSGVANPRLSHKI
jgi:hypothetical protein